MTLKECMALKEIIPTTIFSVKLMHDCTWCFEPRHFHLKSHQRDVILPSRKGQTKKQPNSKKHRDKEGRTIYFHKNMELSGFAHDHELGII